MRHIFILVLLLRIVDRLGGGRLIGSLHILTFFLQVFLQNLIFINILQIKTTSPCFYDRSKGFILSHSNPAFDSYQI